eukprot:jgi/Hompol1/455/HPOL_005312-RA
MGAEVGATSSLFPFTESMQRFLDSTNRSAIAAEAAKAGAYLKADHGAEYDSVVEINLSELEPRLNGPFTPDRSWAVSDMKDAIKENGWPQVASAALIGSCTNSSYEDMTRAASLVKQAASAGLKPKIPFMITPGSEQIRATMERDGLIATFENSGGLVLANACGPCIGQWKRTDLTEDKENAIVTSFNRNFKKRNDGYDKTMNFLASPELVTAVAFSGQLGFNPSTDSITNSDGVEFRFQVPIGIELPATGFSSATTQECVEKSQPDPAASVVVDPSSSRLQLITAFDPWNGREVTDAKLLVKVAGKCTTDHISAAGPWLKYKGHLENISKNTLIGATNAFSGKVNLTLNALTGQTGTIPDVAFAYKAAGVPWIVVGDWNYGEGSAREHAAMQPRFLGAALIICRSFARIHETNLKKQGILPLTFADPADYDRIPEFASFSTVGLTSLAPGSTVTLVVTPVDKPAFKIPLVHTMSIDQIEWFKAGSALNLIAAAQSLADQSKPHSQLP